MGASVGLIVLGGGPIPRSVTSSLNPRQYLSGSDRYCLEVA